MWARLISNFNHLIKTIGTNLRENQVEKSKKIFSTLKVFVRLTHCYSNGLLPLARSSSNSVNHRDNYYKNPPRPFKSPIRLLLKAVAAQKSHSVEFFKASICRNPPLTFAEVMLLRSAEWFEPFLLLAHILRCFLLKDQSWCSNLYRRKKKNSDRHKTVTPT